jgi:hypothetical protein
VKQSKQKQTTTTKGQGLVQQGKYRNDRHKTTPGGHHDAPTAASTPTLPKEEPGIANNKPKEQMTPRIK